MHKSRRLIELLIGLVVTISTLILLSMGALSLLGSVFAIPAGESRHSTLDRHAELDGEQFMPDRL
jgi:hypothetical protein